MSVVLDLTPNYLGNAPWFNGDVGDVLEKVKVGHTPCSFSHSSVCVCSAVRLYVIEQFLLL